jgi:hypothetical protein
MQIALPLDRRTVAGKFNALEAIWDSLKHSPADVPLPAWHADVLAARRTRVNAGASTDGDWGDAKRRLRERVR